MTRPNWEKLYPGRRAVTVLLPKEKAVMLLLGSNEISPGVVLVDHFILAKPRELAPDRDEVAERPSPVKSVARRRGRLRRQARKVTDTDRELIDRAIADGKVKVLKPGFGLGLNWLDEGR